jgi:hypothetical protein
MTLLLSGNTKREEDFSPSLLILTYSCEGCRNNPKSQPTVHIAILILGLGIADTSIEFDLIGKEFERIIQSHAIHGFQITNLPGFPFEKLQSFFCPLEIQSEKTSIRNRRFFVRRKFQSLDSCNNNPNGLFYSIIILELCDLS